MGYYSMAEDWHLQRYLVLDTVLAETWAQFPTLSFLDV